MERTPLLSRLSTLISSSLSSASRLPSWRAAVFVAAAATTPMVAMAQGAGADWSTPSGTAQATRFSSLTGITSANVGTLVEEFSAPSG